MSYKALYRKYRPQVFEEVVGQGHITTTLKNQIMDNKITHAYLFAGIRGTGKTSTAKVFARAVNCQQRADGNPCNSCSVCTKALAGNLMDIIEIDAASNRGVDEIRDLREKVKYPPSTGKYRVYIVDEVHMLTMEAFNALLKTLEEPPSHVVFILATTEPHKLPATILSRCQRFDFKRISVSDIVSRLKSVVELTEIEVDEEALELIARNADGALRDALSLLDQCLAFERGKKLTVDRTVSILGMASFELLVKISEGIINRDAGRCIQLLNSAVDEGKDIGQLFKDLICHFRDLLITKTSDVTIVETSGERAQILKNLVQKMETNTLIRIINVLTEAESKAKWVSQPRIYLEVSIIKLCRPSMDASLEGLQERVAQLENILLKEGLPKTNTIERDYKEEKVIAESIEKIDEDKSKFTEEMPLIESIEKGENAESEEKKEKNTQDICHEKEIKLEQIEGRWNEILKNLEKSKKGFFTLIKDARPLKINGMNLIIGCGSLHGIYQDIVNRKENIETLQDIIHSITGMKLDIKIENIENVSKSPHKEEPPEVFDLAVEAKKIFGEDLVEVIEEFQEGM